MLNDHHDMKFNIEKKKQMNYLPTTNKFNSFSRILHEIFRFCLSFLIYFCFHSCLDQVISCFLSGFLSICLGGCFALFMECIYLYLQNWYLDLLHFFHNYISHFAPMKLIIKIKIKTLNLIKPSSSSSCSRLRT